MKFVTRIVIYPVGLCPPPCTVPGERDRLATRLLTKFRVSTSTGRKAADGSEFNLMPGTALLLIEDARKAKVVNLLLPKVVLEGEVVGDTSSAHFRLVRSGEEFYEFYLREPNPIEQKGLETMELVLEMLLGMCPAP